MIPKRFSRPKTYTYRCQLADGGMPFIGKAAVSDEFKVLLRDQDSAFELIYNRHANRIEAYRVKMRGASPSHDYLVHQFTLKDLPGPWLLDYLRKTDLWKRFGGPDKHTETILSAIDKEDDERDKALDDALTTFSEKFSRDAAEYMRRDRVYGIFSK